MSPHTNLGGECEKMAAGVGNFTDWLSNKLKNLNTDENVFGSYITSILEGDDSVEEKREGLQSILSEIIDKVSWLDGLLLFSR